MFTRPTLMLMLSTLLAAVGCADERVLDTTTTGLTGSDSDPTVDDEGEDDGADDEGIATKSEEPPVDALLACDLDVACEFPLELVRDQPATAYADSDACALEALARGEVSLIQTVAVFPDAEAYADYVVSDGSLLRQGHGRSDALGIWQKPVERCRIKPFVYFAHCLEQFSAGCLDPETWIVADSCEPLGSLTCPAP